jgi:hypothetical protein
MAEEPRDPLQHLQRWYLRQCDGEWEHSYGLTLSTLDNPGWSLRIDVAETNLAGQIRGWDKVERPEHDWLHWRMSDDVFEAACGPTNLIEAVHAFLDVAQSSSDA